MQTILAFPIVNLQVMNKGWYILVPSNSSESWNCFLNWIQDQLHNLQNPEKNEDAGPPVRKLLKISRWWSELIETRMEHYLIYGLHT